MGCEEQNARQLAIGAKTRSRAFTGVCSHSRLPTRLGIASQWTLNFQTAGTTVNHLPHTSLSLSLSLFYIPFLCHAIEGPQNRLFGLQAIILLSCVETPTAIATKASQEQRHRVPQVIWTVHVMNNLFLIISERHLGLHHGGRDAANFIPYISRLDLDPKSPCSLIPCAHKVQVACILSIIDSRICWYNFT